MPKKNKKPIEQKLVENKNPSKGTDHRSNQRLDHPYFDHDQERQRFQKRLRHAVQSDLSLHRAVKRTRAALKALRCAWPDPESYDEALSDVIEQLMDLQQDGHRLAYVSADFAKTPAAKVLYAKVAYWLLVLGAAGADLDVRDRAGRAALHNAVVTGNIAAFDRLIELGASKDVVDVDGNTPLHLAVWWSSVPMLNRVLEHGLNPLLRNHNGHTPYDCVRDSQIPDLIALFEGQDHEEHDIGPQNDEHRDDQQHTLDFQVLFSSGTNGPSSDAVDDSSDGDPAEWRRIEEEIRRIRILYGENPDDNQL